MAVDQRYQAGMRLELMFPKDQTAILKGGNPGDGYFFQKMDTLHVKEGKKIKKYS